MSSFIIFGDGQSALSWTGARDLVRSDLWRSAAQGLADDVVDRGLHASLRRLEAERRWLWLEKIDATLVATIDGAQLTLPASIKSIASLAYLSGTRAYEPLMPMRIADIRNLTRGTTNGTPTAYCFHGGSLYFDHQVKSGSQFEAVYKSGIPPVIPDAIESPSVTLALQRSAVIAGACAWIAMTRLKNETESARHEAAYQNFLQTMMDEEDEARGDETGGLISPDTSYRAAAFGRSARYA